MEISLNGLRRDAPTDARQVRSRNALTGALLALIEEKPFDQLTIREITGRAGTGYATFFRHYPTKEALLADVASGETYIAQAIHKKYTFSPQVVAVAEDISDLNFTAGQEGQKK